jgi:magnesium transporter
MSLGSIQFKHFFKASLKELIISAISGIALGVVAFAFALIVYKNLNLGFVLLITLVVAVALGKVLGVSIPMLMKKLKFDPALMSSPIITILADAGAVLVYFLLAKALLGV